MSEYWIQEDGSVEFANGDVGDQNHEAIVVNDVQKQIIDKCQSTYRNIGDFDRGEYVDWDGFKAALVKAYSPIFYKSRPLFTKSWVKHQTNYDPQAFEWSALKRAGVNKEEWACAEGLGDARDYAMSKWGWKTYRNGNIDTWRLTKSDLKSIISGIESIADESGWSDKKLNRTSFSINVFSNQKHFSLTFSQMQKWLQGPSLPSMQDQDWKYNTSDHQSAMSKSNRDYEIQNMNPAYRRPGVNPIGDSVLSFRAFIENNKDCE